MCEFELSQSEQVHVNNFLQLPKPFILLAGISGTGKTRYVREQASAHNADGRNYCIVPVRPDWHEPSDLLGYVSRISDKVKAEYVTTKVLIFIIDAWRAVAPGASAEGMGELDFNVPPYWLCLDEMNLAPVEQYFADYLSVLESRKFEGGEYYCEPLLDASILKTKDTHMQSDLGLIHDDDLWQYFLKHGIALPPNLIVAGTVNMDETTHGFSRKVIDRALTLDFGEFFPNDYDRFFGGQDKNRLFTYSLLTQTTREDLDGSIDPDGSKTIGFLKAVNHILKQTPFELAYRALNELLLHVASFAPQDDRYLQAIWDDFLMTKILPRIDGDEDKLRVIMDGESKNLLDEVSGLLEVQLASIWNSTRPDLFRETVNSEVIDTIPCRSKNKLEWMKARLESNTFTSFWP
ncbi:hypothetical protein ACH42_14630 [Endozoicomonas sp. (ex Bugula neritina AB1)]|nr:hypothetical protein ACH42_14630 [Endozoicomonas sp. (ex Bugula neritina AB1)]